jgi:hypothetical protein
MEGGEIKNKNIMLAMLMLTVSVSRKEKTQKINKEVTVHDATKKAFK